MNSRWRSDMPSEECSSSSTKPLIEVNGLRSSCEAVATNSLLARSSRARSLMSRTVHTMPAWALPSRAAVTASERPPVLDPGLLGECRRLAWERAVLAVDQATDGQLGHELGGARVHGGDHARSRLGDDQRVAQALDGHGQAPALLLDAVLRGGQVLAHRVERAGQVLELARTGRLDALLELALGQAVGGVDEVVEGTAHRPDEHRDQRERAGQGQHAGDDDQQQRAAGVGSGLLSRLGLACGLAGLERGGEAAGPGERTGDRGGEAPAGRGGAGRALGGDLLLHEPLARRVGLAPATWRWSPRPLYAPAIWRLAAAADGPRASRRTSSSATLAPARLAPAVARDDVALSRFS